MSWEDMGAREHPCNCGKGTYTVFVEMDDWNRVESTTVINCPECREKERVKNERIQKEQIRLEELSKEIRTYFADHYMEEWLNHFVSAKNKKANWNIARNLGVERDSLSTFYSRKYSSMGKYIRSLAEYHNMKAIMNALNIKNDELENKVEEAMKLRSAEDARLIAAWHASH